MTYRDPDTGRFITETQWEALQETSFDEFDDWDDLDEFDSFEEGEYGE